MDEWLDTFHRIINKGMERQQLRPGLNAEEIATIMISTLEGAVMLSSLYKDPIHIKRAAAHINRYLETLRPVAT